MGDPPPPPWTTMQLIDLKKTLTYLRLRNLVGVKVEEEVVLPVDKKHVWARKYRAGHSGVSAAVSFFAFWLHR